MSELTDHLGLTGAERKYCERAWVTWCNILLLDSSSSMRFVRFMLYKSHRINKGLPPGYTWSHYRAGLPQGPFSVSAPPDWERVDAPLAERLADMADRRARRRGGLLPESGSDGRNVFVNDHGIHFVRVRIPVHLDRDPEEVLKNIPHDVIGTAWKMWQEALGLDDEAMAVMRDFLMEEWSAERPPLNLASWNRDETGEMEAFRYSAMVAIRKDPGVHLHLNPLVKVMPTDPKGAWVSGWRRAGTLQEMGLQR